MNRSDFQNLARARAAEAEYLLAGGYYAGAYYLTGYVVECALKACIARRIARYEFPDKKLANDSYTHNLKQLIKDPLKPLKMEDRPLTDGKRDPLLASNWSIVQRWSEQSRYEHRSQAEAEELYRAVMDRRHGVFKWVRQFW